MIIYFHFLSQLCTLYYAVNFWNDVSSEQKLLKLKKTKFIQKKGETWDHPVIFFFDIKLL